MEKQAECYELSLAPDYVSNWTFNDAIRELIQNGIDQQTTNPNNEFAMSYDSLNNQLILRSPLSKLKRDTLLLGCSSKANDDETIGQFGEGYKIAALVLTRLGKTFTIYNNEKNEIWTCRFKNSTKWLHKLLAFYIEKSNTEKTGLDIVIGNVSWREYEEIESDIWLNSGEYEWERIETKYGEILTDEQQEKRVYVNGLYVYTDEDMKYGFNFKPMYLKLERDRKTCSSWDIGELTSKMIMEAVVSGEISLEEVSEMMSGNKTETYHFRFNKDSDDAKKLMKMLIDSFDAENPVFSIPVYSQSQIDRVKILGGKPVVVAESVANLLSEEIENRIKILEESMPLNTLSLKDKLKMWLATYRSEIYKSAAIHELEEIIDSIE